MRSDEVKSVLQSGHRLLVISEGGHHEQSWRREGCPLFDVVHPALPLLATASSTLQGALKDGFGEAVMACDMLEPCKFPSLDCCQERFLWTHKVIDFVPYPAIGLVVQVGDTEKFPNACGFESLEPFIKSQNERFVGLLPQWTNVHCKKMDLWLVGLLLIWTFDCLTIDISEC